METAAAVSNLTPKGRATRDRIAAAASALILERGVAGTRTEDVQLAAGVSASQLYHYFTNKKNLIRAVITHQTWAVLAAQQPHLGELDSFEALAAWRDLVVDAQRQRQCQGGCPLGTLACELAETWPDARADLAASFGVWEDAIRTGFQRMVERGALRSDANPDRLALALLVAVQGGLLLTQTRRDTRALEAGLDVMLAHIASLIT